MMEEDTKLCSNCKRQIAANNFTMHELHCHRNIILCDTCGEPVPRSQMKDHVDSIHSTAVCPLCSEEVEISKLPVHEEQLCTKRHIKCAICEIDTPFDQYEDHLDYCESRTQECPNCRQYVMMKDWDRHENSNCQYPEPRSDDSLTIDGPQATGDVRTVVRENSFVAKELQRMFFPQQGLQTYGYSHGLSAVDFPLDGESTMLPCEFCNNLFSSDVIFSHQSSCPRDTSFSRVDDSLASRLHTGLAIAPDLSGERYAFRRQMEGSDEDDTVDPVRRDSSSFDTPLPCEFCEELFPMTELPAHQAQCPRDSLSSARGPRQPYFEEDYRAVADLPAARVSPPRERPIDDFLKPIGVRPHNNRRAPPPPVARNEEPPLLSFGSGMWSSGTSRPTEHPEVFPSRRERSYDGLHAHPRHRTQPTDSTVSGVRVGRGTHNAPVRGRGSSRGNAQSRRPYRRRNHRDDI